MISLFITLCFVFQEPAVVVQPLQFLVTHNGSAGDSIDGRLFVLLTEGTLPRIGGPDWFNAEPVSD